jgi:hypothetical protein
MICEKAVQILRNVSRQVIEEEWMARIFYTSHFSLKDDHFFMKKYRSKAPSKN